jgi:septal ring-binding cell division protein DamX
MRVYLAVAGALIVMSSLSVSITPAQADFYLAKDPTKKKCKIVETEPDGQNLIMLGTASYATKDEAKVALAKTTSEECPNNPTEFYVGKDPATNHCKVMHKKPDGKATLMIGTSSYATEEEAKAARSKTTPEECPRPSAPKQ